MASPPPCTLRSRCAFLTAPEMVPGVRVGGTNPPGMGCGLVGGGLVGGGGGATGPVMVGIPTAPVCQLSEMTDRSKCPPLVAGSAYWVAWLLGTK